MIGTGSEGEEEVWLGWQGDRGQFDCGAATSLVRRPLFIGDCFFFSSSTAPPTPFHFHFKGLLRRFAAKQVKTDRPNSLWRRPLLHSDSEGQFLFFGWLRTVCVWLYFNSLLLLSFCMYRRWHFSTVKHHLPCLTTATNLKLILSVKINWLLCCIIGLEWGFYEINKIILPWTVFEADCVCFRWFFCEWLVNMQLFPWWKCRRKKH